MRKNSTSSSTPNLRHRSRCLPAAPPRLGVCVVDEQHRFGVEQRRALDSKGVEGMAPHVLHMTATPIPRTLSLTAYGDLATTALHQLPAGRVAGAPGRD